MRRFRSEQRAAVIPLTLFLILAFIWFMFPMVTWMMLDGTRTLTQRAADAAALAGASQAILSQQTDARGAVYCDTVAVDASAGPVAAAQYWQKNTAALPSLQTTAFTAVSNANSLSVTASVTAPSGGFVFWGFTTLNWSVTATATALYPPGSTPC